MSNIVSINDQQKIADWLSIQTPDTVSRHIESRAKAKGLKIDIDHRFEYPDGRKSRKIPHCVRVVGNMQNAPAMAHEVEKLMSPADKKTIKKWLVMLDAISAKPKDSEATTDIALEAYAQHLLAYPADIAKHVLINMTWKFFPTWADLKEEADALVSERRMIIHQLKNTKQETKQPEKQKTKEEKKAEFMAIDEILKNAGFSPKVAWED